MSPQPVYEIPRPLLLPRPPPTRRIHVNGKLGPKFPINSGVAQGCPLSPLLFLVITEPLARLISADTRIKGYPIRTASIKIMIYADDTAIVGSIGNEPYIEEDLLTIWKGATTMVENIPKRGGILIGPWRHDAGSAPTTALPDNNWTRRLHDLPGHTNRSRLRHKGVVGEQAKSS